VSCSSWANVIAPRPTSRRPLLSLPGAFQCSTSHTTLVNLLGTETAGCRTRLRYHTKSMAKSRRWSQQANDRLGYINSQWGCRGMIIYDIAPYIDELGFLASGWTIFMTLTWKYYVRNITCRGSLIAGKAELAPTDSTIVKAISECASQS
jgi:hypothetical protein